MTSAVVEVLDRDQKLVKSRILLDTCATANFVTDNFVNKLKLKRNKCAVTIGALNDLTTSTTQSVEIAFSSLHSNFQKKLTFLIVPKITELVPTETIPKNCVNIPPNIKLADPEFFKPASINMLLGAGPTLSLFSIGQIRISDTGNDLFLQKTRLGWIIGGECNSVHSTKKHKCLLAETQFDLERFWRIEEREIKRELSSEEKACEQHFKENIERDKNGRYVVSLPFKNNRCELGNSKTLAIKFLNNLLRKFKINKSFEQEYTKVIDEYISLGHMTELKITSDDGYYLPHLAVIKNSSSTTKLRTVFHASAKSTNGKSINDNLMTGPVIQEDLFAHLIRFRSFPYVILADIEKMYRQFLIKPEDRKYQKILWPVHGVIKEFCLNTVTFGFAPSSFLAIRCLHQLASDEQDKFPLAAYALKHHLYVDNVITGVDSIAAGEQLRDELIGILKTAKIHLRQWASNCAEILRGITEKDLDKNYNMDLDQSLKTLGIYWNPSKDVFIYSINKISMDKKFTKRTVLSEIAKIFDPLGLLGPIVLQAKKIMQELWNAKIDWDESLPAYIREDWVKFCSQLNSLDNLSFKRAIKKRNTAETQIHGFCDASIKGYGACIYMRSRDENNQWQTSLICSKSRVAPLKTVSLPRLELCGAVLLAQLYKTTTEAMNLKSSKCCLWSDSSIVLSWIKTEPNALKVFVANRIVEIQTLTDTECWRHVRSADNPADALSRGQLPLEFLNNKLWKSGPLWLGKPESTWPKNIVPTVNDIPEIRTVKCLISHPFTNIFLNYSSFDKTVRITAWCLRLLKKNRHFCNNHRILQIEELKNAEKNLIRATQNNCYSYEIKRLKENKPINGKTKLASLDPFLDKDNILRVGGRIHQAMVSFVVRHPIILPRNNHLTDCIIRDCHLKNFQTGNLATLNSLRQRYWPVDGKNQVRKIIRRCVPCFKAKPCIVSYKPGDLPSVRINKARVFNNVGIDYCGPFYIKEKIFRNKKKIKAYIAIFICMVVKAVHIEVVRDLSTEAFLAALRRFIGRRGLPKKIFSDNGSNFVGANNELRELHELLNSNELISTVTEKMHNQNVEWHFIPPYAPNFGGLWEAAVKSFKHHFKRTLSDKLLSYDQLETTCIEIEAILNSRPLTPLSQDPNDLLALTPGHFIIGDSLKRVPEHDLQDMPSNRLSM